MPNIFYLLTGIMGLALLILSLGRQVSWALDKPPFAILQYGLAFEAGYMFFLGCLWEIVA